MADWLNGATRDPIPGVSGAGWESESKPAWKLLLHTTEGGSYAGARAAYVGGRYAPHVTLGPDPSNPNRVKAWQHLSFDHRATTLSDRSGGIRPNREHVLQVEIVGFCDPKWKTHKLYVHNWSDAYKRGLAEWLNAIRAAKPIPARSTVKWVDYPKSYGLNASQRLSASAFDDYEGILGHQHAPESTHGDPGDLSAFVREYLLGKPAPPPQKDDDMPNFRHFAATESTLLVPGEWRDIKWPHEYRDTPGDTHAEGGYSYRRPNAGYTTHHLRGLKIEGLAKGQEFQVRLVLRKLWEYDIVWSKVLVDQAATSGSQYVAVSTLLRSDHQQAVQWQATYFGERRDVKVAGGEWLMEEYA